jgi:amidase
MENPKKDRKAVVVRKRAAREALLPPKWLVPEYELPNKEVYDVANLCSDKGWLTPEELDITTKTVTQLAAVIAVGRVSALQVVSAFAHRATIAQQLFNPYVLLSPFVSVTRADTPG